MIYLIGGAPRIGKSTIAKQLAQSIGGRFVATDELEVPNKDPSVIFYSGAEKNIQTPDERIEAIINEAKQKTPLIENVINSSVKESRDTVIEGVHLFPVYVAKFMQTHGEANIKAISIGSTDIELILNGMRYNTSPNNWSKDFTQAVLRQIALFTRAFSEYVRDESQKYHLQYQERSNDFQKDTLDVLRELSIEKK
jgi:2-phosphoglycerate kinase